MRLPKPKPKPKPPKKPPDEPKEHSGEGYESCEQGSASMLTSTLLAHAQEVAEQVQSEDPDMALLLQALCDRLDKKQAGYHRLRDRFSDVQEELDDAKVTKTTPRPSTRTSQGKRTGTGSRFGA